MIVHFLCNDIVAFDAMVILYNFLVSDRFCSYTSLFSIQLIVSSLVLSMY